MYNLLLCFLASVLLVSCSFTNPQNDFTLKRAEGFPKWLNGTDQTSGITFIGLDSLGNKNFLLADDTGKLHRMSINNDTVLSIKDIHLSSNVTGFLSSFPKWDFEEIVYDKYTGNFYLSIEGNGPLFNDFVGIYQIKYLNNNVYSDSIISIERMAFTPSSQFLAHTSSNIGYEGVTVDSNYFYLGLEGFPIGPLFADSTIIYIAEKNSLKIIDSINTGQYSISTVCGLYSDKNNSIYGIDRNGRKVFHLLFNDKHKVINSSIQNIMSDMPVYHYEYVAALESITMDNENNLYLVDDPWKKFYVPSEEVLNKTDQQTKENFKNAVPIIYKFKIIY